MKKKILSIVLAVVLVLSCVPVIITAASAEENTSMSFSSVTFKGYKGWMNPSAGDQERYKQRSYDLGLQAGNLSNILSGSAAQAQSNNVGDYYPELYLDASGKLIRDNRYDNVDTTIDLNTYLAEGYGKYYGVFTFQFSSYVVLDTFTVYNKAAWWHLDRGFDILYSEDGTTWTVAAEYRNMGAYENWDSATAEAFLGADCLHRTTNFDGVRALYVAVAVTDPAGGGPCCALWYASATGTAATSVSVSSVTYKSYQSYLSGTYSNRRSWDRFTLTEGNKAIVNCETDKGGTVAYKAYSYPTKDYFPAVYLNDDGQLVRDSRYDNNGNDVNLATYQTEGYGKYYGVYIIKFATPVLLDSFVVYNNTSWYHLTQAFDVLYSADGNIWTKKASYTGMGDWAKWDSSSTTSIDGSACLRKTTDMGGVNAWYVAVAISSPAGQDDHRCCLWYTESTGRAATEVYASNSATLTNAVTYANSNPGTTIKITKDMTCNSTVGTISAADTVLDGQNHTIYNLQQTFVNVNGAGVTVKDLIFSNLTEPDGAEMRLKHVVSLFGNIAGGTADDPVSIKNVTNQRNVIEVNSICGQFAQTVSGNVVFSDCVNEGNMIATNASGSNYKIGGFVGGVDTAGAEVTFSSCTNTGNVSGSQVGGFIGVFGDEAGVTITMTDCRNNGTVTGFADSVANKGFGIAGGLIGGVNNTKTIVADTYITLTECVNNGDVRVENVEENSKQNAIGGLIGLAGAVAEKDRDTTVEINLYDCAVYGCDIDTAGADFFAAPLIGKCSPQNDDYYNVTAKNCYVSKVNVSAPGNARKLIGVESYVQDDLIVSYNCVMNELTENGLETWNDYAYDGMKADRKYTANNGFDDTDIENLIGKGKAPYAQQATYQGEGGTLRKVRFVGTISEATFDSETYDRYGFFVTAKIKSDNSVKAWNLSGTRVYESLNANGLEELVADALGDTYAFALTITDIPANLAISFRVTPYLVAKDGSIIFGTSGTLNLS